MADTTTIKEQEIQRRVLELTIKQPKWMKEDSGVGSSLAEEDVKQYVDDVLKEVKGTDKV